jgi:MinD superfamily P-loop ATPase
MHLVIVSGKGGTGKTTIASSLARLNDQHTVKIDCDVDASNLYLMSENLIQKQEDFYGAKVAIIDQESCIQCGKCFEVCRFGAIKVQPNKVLVDDLKCEGCGACTIVCPSKAISLEEEVTGQTLVSINGSDYLSYAEMIPGAEGSGKLVTAVKQNARPYITKETDIIIDGSPGIGCAVMASIVGSDTCLVVTEGTQSGFEDLKRVLDLLKYYQLSVYVCINKYDVNKEKSNEISIYCQENDIRVIGRVPFDKTVIQSINEGIALVDYKESEAGLAIKNMWNIIKGELK